MHHTRSVPDCDERRGDGRGGGGGGRRSQESRQAKSEGDKRQPKSSLSKQSRRELDGLGGRVVDGEWGANGDGSIGSVSRAAVLTRSGLAKPATEWFCQNSAKDDHGKTCTADGCQATEGPFRVAEVANEIPSSHQVRDSMVPGPANPLRYGPAAWAIEMAPSSVFLGCVGTPPLSPETRRGSRLFLARGTEARSGRGDEEGSGVNLPPVCLQPKNSLEAGPDMGEAIPKSICRRPSRLPDRGRAINLDLDAGWWCCWCCWCCRASCRRWTGSLSEPVPETRVKEASLASVGRPSLIGLPDSWFPPSLPRVHLQGDVTAARRHPRCRIDTSCISCGVSCRRVAGNDGLGVMEGSS